MEIRLKKDEVGEILRKAFKERIPSLGKVEVEIGSIYGNDFVTIKEIMPETENPKDTKDGEQHV